MQWIWDEKQLHFGVSGCLWLIIVIDSTHQNISCCWVWFENPVRSHFDLTKFPILWHRKVLIVKIIGVNFDAIFDTTETIHIFPIHFMNRFAMYCKSNCKFAMSIATYCFEGFALHRVEIWDVLRTQM